MIDSSNGLITILNPRWCRWTIGCSAKLPLAFGEDGSFADADMVRLRL